MDGLVPSPGVISSVCIGAAWINKQEPESVSAVVVQEWGVA